MNDIREIKFTNGLTAPGDGSPINNAIKELISVFTTAVDGNNQIIFETVREGNVVTADIMPKDGEGICLRIFRVVPAQNQVNVTPNYNFRKKVVLCIAPCFELMTDGATTIEGFGDVEPIDWYRENLKREAQKILEDISLTGNLTSLTAGQTQWWNFGKQTEEREMEANYLMDFEKQIPLKPSWYSCPFLKILEVDVR